MALITRETRRKPTIDLADPEGNAFALLGYASRYAKDLGLNAKQIQSDMTAGDYKHLVHVFEKHFGEYVDLVLPEDGL